MSDGTKIEWTDATVNAVNGCSVVSPGCTNCYAMRLAGTRMKHHPSRAGLTVDSKAGPVWTGEVRLSEIALLQPLAWRRPRRIFWNAHGDLFHPKVPDEWIDRVFAVCALTPQHSHQILTKRPERMRAYSSDPATPGRIARAVLDMAIADAGMWGRADWPVRSVGDIDDPEDVTVRWPLPSVWLGTSVEDQTRADERIPHLLATPAAVRFLSCEPLLGQVDIAAAMSTRGALEVLFARHAADHPTDMRGSLHWVIAGGESGPGARPMQNEWAQSLVDQCTAAGVAVFVKQLSSGGPKAIKDIALFPEGLRVREMPRTAPARPVEAIRLDIERMA